MSDDQKQNQLFESVSALVDNQATPLELQRILAHTEKSTGVRERWHRYQLTRAALRGEAKVCGADLSDRVKAAIADLEMDPVLDSDTQAEKTKADSQKQNRFWYPAYGRVAIAASVALAVVLGAQQFPILGDDSVEPALATNPNMTAGGYQRADLGINPNLSRLNVQNVGSASFSVPSSTSSPARTVSLSDMQAQRQQQLAEEQVRQAIQRLMLEHAQQTTRDQSTGLMPFIRVSDAAIISETSQ